MRARERSSEAGARICTPGCHLSLNCNIMASLALVAGEVFGHHNLERSFATTSDPLMTALDARLLSSD
jgi:hypothetical protein